MSATTTLDPDEQENWPTMSGAWQDAIQSLEVEMYKLEQAILRFPEERLEERARTRSPNLLRFASWRHSAFRLPCRTNSSVKEDSCLDMFCQLNQSDNWERNTRDDDYEGCD